MAYVRHLPSGLWQATVRLPNGRKTTRTDPLKRVVTAGQRVLEPWCVVLSTAAVALSLAAWAARRFDRLEAESFDRGLRAGMGIGGVPLMDKHRSS